MDDQKESVVHMEGWMSCGAYREDVQPTERGRVKRGLSPQWWEGGFQIGTSGGTKMKTKKNKKSEMIGRWKNPTCQQQAV